MYKKPTRKQLVPQTANMRDLYVDAFADAFAKDDSGNIVLHDIHRRDPDYFDKVYDYANRKATYNKNTTINEVIHRRGYDDAAFLADKIEVDGQTVTYTPVASELLFEAPEVPDFQENDLHQRLSKELEAVSADYKSNPNLDYSNDQKGYSLEEHEQFVTPTEPTDTVITFPGTNQDPIFLKAGSEYANGFATQGLAVEEVIEDPDLYDQQVSRLLNDGFNAFDVAVYPNDEHVEPLPYRDMSRLELNRAGSVAYDTYYDHQFEDDVDVSTIQPESETTKRESESEPEL